MVEKKGNGVKNPNIQEFLELILIPSQDLQRRKRHFQTLFLVVQADFSRSLQRQLFLVLHQIAII